MNTQRLLNAATDCISRFRSSHFPLKNVASDIIKARKLNSSDRKALLDVVFRFSREINLIYKFIDENLKFSSSMSVQQKDAFALSLISSSLPGLVPSPEMTQLSDNYQHFLSTLKDEKYLISLGPLISDALKADYQDSAIAIAESFSERSKKFLAIDRRFVTVERVCSILTDLKIDHFRHPMMPLAVGTHESLDLSSFPSEIREHVWLMDAGSQIIAELVNPKPHETVLDLCVGEGGKAHYITMKDCQLVAVDVDEARLNRAKKRLKHQKIEFICADGRNPPLKPESFDWVLLDAPCSGIGVLRRRYDLVHQLSKKDVGNYIGLQRQLLKSAANLLKPNGKLIYATCSLLKAENEQQIAWLQRENSQIKPLQLSNLVGEYLKFSDDALNNNSLTLYPHIHDCDGFYFASLTK